MSDPPSSPEDSYAIPLPPTTPATPESSQQLSPPRSEESTVLGHADEGPAGMEVQNGPSDENAPCKSDDPDAPLSHCLLRIEFFKCLESAVLNRTLKLRQAFQILIPHTVEIGPVGHARFVRFEAEKRAQRGAVHPPPPPPPPLHPRFSPVTSE
ncbi:hypothetical protein KOW79_020610 [Hemibagrus wyckioides]|uniref:Uncharacterized protein n=1 Tax=Hemibagrus wyckioides TaxID=337641 RepID=A0A9D3N4C8_9TELE|nr:hypothetical protein KOW79_020610 [Hemibagrus wyckioides]